MPRGKVISHRHTSVSSDRVLLTWRTARLWGRQQILVLVVCFSHHVDRVCSFILRELLEIWLANKNGVLPICHSLHGERNFDSQLFIEVNSVFVNGVFLHIQQTYLRNPSPTFTLLFALVWFEIFCFLLLLVTNSVSCFGLTVWSSLICGWWTIKPKLWAQKG